MDIDATDVRPFASTGRLPDATRLEELLDAAYDRAAALVGGQVAGYIPELAAADPDRFGVSVMEVSGVSHERGDAQVPFSIQSISKAFVWALVCAEIGHEEIRRLVGVNNTGLPFNSVTAVELHEGHPRNPMVNAGAIATTALVPGSDPDERFGWVLEGLSRFAGRRLGLDDAVLASEAATNGRNRALATLLASYGRLAGDPAEAVDVYTRQCSVLVDSHDLAVMGATLADGGVNPVTGESVVPADVCRDTLSVMATSGMYEDSGEWLFRVGLPAKSGVAGGLVAISPGKGAVGAFSPRLDAAGNTVRGQEVVGVLARSLGLDIFASTPAAGIADPTGRH